MHLRHNLLTTITASVVAIIGFEISIIIDGSINIYLHRLAEYLNSPLLFTDPTNSFYTSLISATISHTLTAVVLVLPILYFLINNHKVFIITYVAALFVYIIYELMLYETIPWEIHIFAIDRLLFQSVWLVILYFMKRRTPLLQVGTK